MVDVKGFETGVPHQSSHFLLEFAPFMQLPVEFMVEESLTDAIENRPKSIIRS